MRLLAYTLRRLVALVPVLLAALVLTFVLTRILPGDPINRVSGGIPMTPDQEDRLRAQLGLDKSLPEQFVDYVAGLFRGEMGTSFTTAQEVSRDLTERFGATFELVTLSVGIAVLLAVPLGVWAAVNKDTWKDGIARVLSVLGVSVPIFWLALVLLYVFFYSLDWLPGPVGRTGSVTVPLESITGVATVDALLRGDPAGLRDALRALVLPCVTIALVTMAPIARMTRSAMVEVLESDYVRTARAIGLPSRTVIWRNAFKNALVPVLTMVVTVYGYALGGTVIVEIIFAWPGLGTYAYNAIMASDFPAIQGVVLLITGLYVAIYLVLDVLIAHLDPRVRY